MAKKSYKIPESLDKTVGDMEISFQSADGAGVKPIKIRTVLMAIGSVMVLFLLISKTFIGNSGIGLIILFSILWLTMTVLLLFPDKTGIPQGSLAASMLNYLPKKMRRITTRKSSPALGFYQLVGIEKVNDKNGLITFVDGTYGYLYQVSGTASILLFPSDRDAILDAADDFWRRVPADCEYIFITTKEAQKVYSQMGAMKRRYDALEGEDPDLQALINNNYKILHDHVGSQYRSIHQYLLIKGDNLEALRRAHAILNYEVESSTLLFKQCKALHRTEDLARCFATIYKGKESV